MSGCLSIIGTAGRRDDARRIDRALYDAMLEEALGTLSRWDVGSAVSGGAAVADHLAVRLFLDGKVSELTLYLPADFRNGSFVPNPAVRFNPGATCNQYHRAFSASCGLDSLAEIEAAIRIGARVEVHEGFHRRNSEVADGCTHMLAFTFGEGDAADIRPDDPGFADARKAGLKDGGTAHTWGECWKARLKRHVNLNALSRRSLT